jgi:hypothetical protein
MISKRKTSFYLALAIVAVALCPPPSARAQDDGGSGSAPEVAVAPIPGAPSGLALDRAPNGDILVYRRVSDWERRQIKKRGGLFVTPGSGESFVSTSRAYVDQLGDRHPKDYANLMVIELDPTALAEFEKIGLRGSGVLPKQLYPKMPTMEKDRPDAIHFKAELGALNLGLRDGSVAVFNKHVTTIRVDETARLAVPKDAGSIKQAERDKRAEERAKRGLNSRLTTGPDASDADVARFTDHVEDHGGSVERVPSSDLPEGATARTTLDDAGRPLVLLPEEGVKKLALVEELVHVIQLGRAIEKEGAASIGLLLDDARDGVASAVRTVEGWEVRAHRLMLGLLGEDDPARVDVEARLAEHESAVAAAEPVDPRVAPLASLSIPELAARVGADLPEGPLTKTALIARLTGATPDAVDADLAKIEAVGAAPAAESDRGRDRDATAGRAEPGIVTELDRVRSPGEGRDLSVER